jgi:pimeloyl-ACP methyl ester carboxylesterase
VTGLAVAALSDVSIRFRSAGSGDEPVAFLQGFGGDARHGEEVAGAKECTRTVLVDLLGFVRSTSVALVYSVEEQARRFAESLT